MKNAPSNKRFQNSYYKKMLFLYSGIFLLSSIIMTGILFYNQHKNLLEIQNKNSQSALAQFQIYTDHYILDQIYDIANNKIYNNPLNNSDILFNSDSYIHDFNNYDDILDIYHFFAGIAQDSPVIDSIYVYDQKNDTFVTTKQGVFYFITSRRQDYKSMLPYALLDYAGEQSASQFFIPPEITSSVSGSCGTVSFVITQPAFVSPDRAELLLFINLDMEDIYREYLHDIDSATTEFMVLSGKNNLLYSTRPERFRTDALPPEVLRDIEASPYGSRSFSQNGSDYMLHWITSTTNDWKYAYSFLQPHWAADVLASAGGVFMISLTVSLFCLFGIYFISNRLYQPIDRLVKYSVQSSPLPNLEAGQDELSVLDAAFHNMSSHIDRLQQVVDKNNSLLLSNTVKELISGTILSHKELNEHLKFTGEELPYPYFYLLCIKPDGSIYAGLDYQKKAFLQISVTDFLNSCSFDGPDSSTRSLTVFHHSGDFTTLVNSDNPGGFPMEILHELLEKLTCEYGNIFNMAVSTSITDFTLFPAVRSTLLGYFKYSYIYGNHNIFTKERIAEYESDALLRAEAPLKLLTAQIKRHDNEGIKKEITVLFQQTRQGKNSLLYTYNLSLQIINLICSECENLGIHSEELSHAGLVNSFSKIRNMEKTLAWFYEVVDLFTSLQKSRTDALDSTVIPGILDYMSKNVDGQLSLNSVADHFGISAGHLSRMFKEKQGVNFSDYVIRLKLETAADMLIKDSSMKVTDIAAVLGYSNVSYFNKMFKEHFGMTPTQYRLNQSSLN